MCYKLRKILFVITGLSYGGAETQLVNLATRIKSQGLDVRVISLTSPKAYVQELESVGISVYSLGIVHKFPDPRLVYRMAHIIHTFQPQIVHSHMSLSNFLTRVACRTVQVPVVICTAHSTYEGGRFRELIYRFTDPLCDLSTQVSQAGLERYVRIKAVPRRKICHVPNGVDIERFCPNFETRCRIRKKMEFGTAFIWLAVGRFDLPKDYPNMLRAFVLVAHARSNVVLTIVGNGPLHQDMIRFAQNLGISGQVNFLGTGRYDVAELMNAADGYVMSSAWEGMPIVLLEASATGVPIVATDVGGNAEVVRDGEAGFLVPPKNPKALADAMIKLMALSEDQRRQMGEVGRQHIETNYSLDRVVDLWKNLYEKLLSKQCSGMRRG